VWASSAETTLISSEFKSGGRPGTLNKFELKPAGSGGKYGLKLVFELEKRPPVEFQVTWPPVDVQASAGFTGQKIPLGEIEECGAVAGEIFLEPSIKAVVTAGSSPSAGFTGALDLKADLFNGSFTWGFPVIQVDFQTGGNKVQILGFTVPN
jgi:hypothetical protein